MFVNTCMCLFSQAPTHTHTHNMKKHARTNTHMLTIYPVIPVYFVYIVSAKLYVLLVVVVCGGVLVLLSYMMCYYGGNNEFI